MRTSPGQVKCVNTVALALARISHTSGLAEGRFLNFPPQINTLRDIWHDRGKNSLFFKLALSAAARTS